MEGGKGRIEAVDLWGQEQRDINITGCRFEVKYCDARLDGFGSLSGVWVISPPRKIEENHAYTLARQPVTVLRQEAERGVMGT